MEFNKTNCEKFLNKMSELLKPLEREFGVKIKRKTGRYTADNLTIRFEILKIDDSGSITKLSNDFKLYAWKFGLKEEDLGKKFEFNGSGYIVTGIAPKSHKYPILAKEIISGKTYKFAVSTIKRALGYKSNERESFSINSSNIGNLKDIL